MAAPIAAVVGAVGLSKWDRLQRQGVLKWKPLGVKYKRYIGTMRITPEAMDKVYWFGGGRGGGKTEMQRELNRQMSQTLEHHREEMDRIYGHHTAARGDDDSGVRKVGGAGAYPSGVIGA
jgi:hypothetical protein